MLQDFMPVWVFLKDLFEAYPPYLISVAAFSFCAVGIVGFLRSI